MYKGVVKIVNQDSNIRVRSLRYHDRAVEYAVKMVEMQQELRMDKLISENKIDTKAMTKLAEILVKFHRYTPTNARIMSFGQPKVMRMKIDENFRTLSKLINIQPK
jgi:aminoglycoside phosphotransferase family enzyme